MEEDIFHVTDEADSSKLPALSNMVQTSESIDVDITLPDENAKVAMEPQASVQHRVSPDVNAPLRIHTANDAAQDTLEKPDDFEQLHGSKKCRQVAIESNETATPDTRLAGSISEDDCNQLRQPGADRRSKENDSNKPNGHLTRPLSSMESVTPGHTHNETTHHGVSDRPHASKVAKRKAKIPSAAQASRKASIRANSSSKPYTAAELYQLANFMKEQENLEEKDQWGRELAAKQAELEAANQFNVGLQLEYDKVKKELDATVAVGRRVEEMFGELGQLREMQKTLLEIGTAYDYAGRLEIISLYDELKRDMPGLIRSCQRSEESLKRLKKTSYTFTKGYVTTLGYLQGTNARLERKLDKQTGVLTERQPPEVAFAKQLDKLQSQHKSTEKVLEGYAKTLGSKLDEFKISAGDRASESSLQQTHHLLQEVSSL